MTHVIAAVVKRFYYIYVEDDDCNLTEEQAVAMAKEQLAENGYAELSEQDGMFYESDDLIHIHYDHDLYL